MFKMDKRKKPGVNRPAGKTTLIADDTELRGDLRFSGAVKIEGRVIGNINTEEGAVSVGQEGYVEGIIKAPSVVINGVVAGDVHAIEHLQRDAVARVDGDLYYRFVEMVSGGQINGQLRFLREGQGEGLNAQAVFREFKSS